MWSFWKEFKKTNYENKLAFLKTQVSIPNKHEKKAVEKSIESSIDGYIDIDKYIDL